MDNKPMRIEAFLIGVKNSLESENSDRNECVVLRNNMALAGEDPCKKCPSKVNCSLMECMPYYLYFSYRWKNLQRRLSRDG